MWDRGGYASSLGASRKRDVFCEAGRANLVGISLAVLVLHRLVDPGPCRGGKRPRGGTACGSG
jgi:hypothetical protein